MGVLFGYVADLTYLCGLKVKEPNKKTIEPVNDFINNFKENHPILLHSLLLIAAMVVVAYALMLFTDIFTAHGKEERVPDVHNLPLEQAIEKLEDAGFNWEIADSVYREDLKPGIVISQEPKGNAYAKKIRTIYLNINAFSPKTIDMPIVTEISMRQALSLLRSMGFKDVGIDTIPSPYEGLVLTVKVNGHQVKPGAKVSVNAQVRLGVGDGSLDPDPIQVLPDETLDSLQEEQRRRARADAETVLN